jgi:hypothetical protein
MLQRAARYAGDEVRHHLEALHTSSKLTTWFRRAHQPMAINVTPEDVIAALSGAGIKCVLMGTHALGGYRSEPRATQGVEVLVRKKDVRRAGRILHERYPELRVNDFPVVTRFVDPATGNVVLDVMKPTQTVYQIVFRHTVPVGDTHEIPSLEMALVSKFAAMVSPNRTRAKKILDASDFVDVVVHNRDQLDVQKLKRLGDRVYPGGGDEVLRFVADIDEDRPIQL